MELESGYFFTTTRAKLGSSNGARYNSIGQ